MISTEVNMKYCSDCKKIYFTENEKCECGKRFSKKLDSNAPIEVICVSSEKRGEAEQCLINAEIPYSVQDRSGYSPSVGKIQGDVAYLVPLSFLKTAIEVLSENGLLEKPEWYSQLPDSAPEWEEMPEGKARAIRIVSIIGFLVLIYICVAGVDYLANLFSILVK